MRKARSTPAKRRTTKKIAAKRKSNPILLFDIIGVALIFLCPIFLVALYKAGSCGFFGQYIAAALRVSVGGIGAYVVSLLLALMGTIMIVGPLKIIPRNIGIGSSMLFLVIISWTSMGIEPGPHDSAIGGGMIGDALAYVFRHAVGSTISYILLVLAAVIAAIIMVDVPDRKSVV